MNLDSLPQGWSRVRLGDVCAPVPKVNPIELGRQSFQYIDIGSIDSSSFTVAAPTLTLATEAPSRARQIVHTGDTVFSTVRPYLKKIGYIEPSLDGEIASTGFCVIRPAAGVSPRYIHYVVTSSWFIDEVSGQQYGVSYPAVRSENILGIEIPLPPMEEQQRIALRVEECLGRLSRSRESLKRAAAQCADYKHAVVDLAVSGRLISPQADWLTAVQTDLRLISENRPSRTSARRPFPLEPAEADFAIPHHWSVVSVDQLSTKIQYGTSVRTIDAPGPGNVPVLRMGNIQDSHVVMDKIKYLPMETPGIPELMLKDGDLLFNRTNSAELVGKSAIYREHLGPATFASYLIRCQFVDHVIPEWVNLVINSSIGRSYVTSVVSQQVGQANVNGSKLARMPIPFPPVREQEHILAAVNMHSALAEQFSQTIQFSLNGADSLRESILAAAFAGRLLPRSSGKATLYGSNNE